MGLATGAEWLLHHTPGGTDVGGVRGALGETWLIQLSVMLHAIGALLIAGALVGVLVAHRRHLQGEAAAVTGWTGKARLRGLIALGWGLNLVGGTMRLFQPDHPPITDFFDVAWVQVITVKHVFLAGAIAASVLAVGLGPLAWRRLRPQAAAFGLLFVVLAAILGGASTTLPIPGMANYADTGAMGLPSQSPGHHVTTYRNFTVPLTAASPLSPMLVELPFDVDPWAFALRAKAEWGIEQNVIQARLVDSNGRVAARFSETAPATIEAQVEKNLYPGTWHVVLESEQALPLGGLDPEQGSDIYVSVRMEAGTHMHRVFEDTVTVTGRFLELNFWMDVGDYFTYNWSVPSAYGSVYWDIHSHPNPPAVNYHHQGEDRTASGNFTAGRDQIYSILWERDPDVAALTLTYRVEGTFRLHSIYD